MSASRTGSRVSREKAEKLSEKVMNFMKKRVIGAKDIVYIRAVEGRATLFLRDGRQIRAFVPVKEFDKVLEPYGFISVNRGVIVNRDEIRHIEGKQYHMKDGTVIEGRVRFLAEHRQMREELRGRKTYGEILLEGKYELYSVLDSLQNAFVLFEMLPLELTGNVRQFRLKYCNTAMEELTGLTFQEMLERRIQKIMPRTSLEWKTVLEEVAISGRTHYLRGTTRKNGKGGRFIILCFQPLGGYCGCVFLPVRKES